jgi:heptose I phosphotransferase
MSAEPRSSLWHRWWHGTVRVWCRPDWPAAAGVDWPTRILTWDAPERFHAKQGRSIGRLRVGPHTLYLKRHTRLPWLDGLRALLWPAGNWSPGAAEWHHLAQAQKLGIPVPTAWAGGEFVGPAGRLQSFLAVAELPDMLPLHEAIPLAQQELSATAFARWKAGLVRELARLSRKLHEAAYFHKDLYLCHFYIPSAHTRQVPATWTEQVWMIDFHRLGWHPLLRGWYQAKDVGQLLYSTDAVAGITDRDRLRFWCHYAGPRQRGWLWQLVRLRGWRNRRHNQKRKATNPDGITGVP